MSAVEGERHRAIARPLAIEVKMPGKYPTPEQTAWLELVASMGWIAGVARSAEDAIDIVEKGRRWEL